MPVWHASVARVNSLYSGVKRLHDWSRTELRMGDEIIAALLRGVGNGMREWREIGETALHVRRQLSAPEVTMLHQRLPAGPVFTHGCVTVPR